VAIERPTVVVVGAGLAGLTCTYRLAQHDVDVVLLEAQDRVGGRCWSSTGWLDGQIAEHGGEHIEEGQEHILELVNHLGLELEDRFDETGDGSMNLNGRSMAPSVVAGFPAVLQKLHEEVGEIGSPRYDMASDAARKLDERTIADWLDESIDGGRQSVLGQAIEAAATLNMTFDATQLSAISLHSMFVGGLESLEEGGGFSFGHVDGDGFPEFHQAVRAAVTDVMHVHGGNDRIVSGLVDRIPDGVLRLQSPLARLSRRTDGRYEVEVSGDRPVLLADQVVLALPFPCLRSVDLDRANLSQRRRDAIAELPMGQGTKLLLQLDKRPSLTEAWPGFAVTDQPYIAFWDTSAGQEGQAGLLTLFMSGPVFSTTQPHAPATSDTLTHARQLLEDVLPGMEQHVGGQGWLDSWPDDPWSQGSYAGFGPGQFTRFFGFLPLPEQGVHFAGEHTSLGSQGYLDGAVESGGRAAREVLTQLSLTESPR